MSAPPIPLYVLGSTGLLAGELLRLVEGHSDLALAGGFSRVGGRSLGAAHPHLCAAADVVTRPLAEAPAVLGDALAAAGGRPVALVLGLPHGRSAEAWRAVRSELGAAAEELAVVDLSADYRLRDAEEHARWYGGPHPDPDEVGRFAYGLPEHGRGPLVGARRVAAPGCFATALQLACLPAARAGLLATDRAWVLHAVTGSSGSGNEPKPGTHHPHRDGNLWAYGLEGHRHEAELVQALRAAGAAVPPLAFLPHSGPFVRGIHLTAALPLARPLDGDAARAVYAEAYAGEPFVEVLAEGVPDLRRVAGSNRAALAASVRGDVLTVLLTLDNIVKGGAGQALQCLNLMLGLPETAGLARAGLGVV